MPFAGVQKSFRDTRNDILKLHLSVTSPRRAGAGTIQRTAGLWGVETSMARGFCLSRASATDAFNGDSSAVPQMISGPERSANRIPSAVGAATELTRSRRPGGSAATTVAASASLAVLVGSAAATTTPSTDEARSKAARPIHQEIFAGVRHRKHRGPLDQLHDDRARPAPADVDRLNCRKGSDSARDRVQVLARQRPSEPHSRS